MKTSEMLAKLKAMASRAGEAIYERATLAAAVLADKQWLNAEFSGDYDKAVAFMEDDLFPELSKAFGLVRLLTLAEAFPSAEDWRTHKYNLNRLWAEWESRHESEKDEKKTERRHATIADLEQRDEKVKDLEFQVKTIGDAIKSKDAEIEKLRIENAELRGEIKMLAKVNEQLRQERRMVLA